MNQLESYTNIARALKAQYPHLRDKDDIEVATQAITLNPGVYDEFLPSPNENAIVALDYNPLNTFAAPEVKQIEENVSDNDLEKEKARAYYNNKYQIKHDDYLLEARAKYEYGENFSWKGVNESNSVIKTSGPLKRNSYGEINGFNKSHPNNAMHVDIESSSIPDEQIITETTSAVLLDHLNGNVDSSKDYVPIVLDEINNQESLSGLAWWRGLAKASRQSTAKRLAAEGVGVGELFIGLEVAGRNVVDGTEIFGRDDLDAIEDWEYLNKLGQNLTKEADEFKAPFTPNINVGMTWQRIFNGTVKSDELQDFGAWIVCQIAFEAPKIAIQLGAATGAGLIKKATQKKIKKKVKGIAKESAEAAAERIAMQKAQREGQLKWAKRAGAGYMGISAAGASAAALDGDINEPFKNLLLPIIDGAVETLSEKFELDVILKPLQKSQVVKGGFYFLKNVGKAAATGAGSETLAQFGSNLNHKLWGEDVYLTEGLAEAATIGAFMDMGMSTGVQAVSGLGNFAINRIEATKNPSKKNTEKFNKTIDDINEQVNENLSNKIVFGYKDGKYIAIEYNDKGEIVDTIEQKDITSLDYVKFIEQITTLKRNTEKDLYHFNMDDSGKAILDYHVYNPELLVEEKIPTKPIRTGGWSNRIMGRMRKTWKNFGETTSEINLLNIKGDHLKKNGELKGSGQHKMGLLKDVIDDLINNVPDKVRTTKNTEKAIRLLLKTFPRTFENLDLNYDPTGKGNANYSGSNHSIQLVANHSLETVLHEMIHAVTYQVIMAQTKNVKAKVQRYSETEADVPFDLEDLRTYFNELGKQDTEVGQLARLMEIYFNETGTDIFLQRFGNKLSDIFQYGSKVDEYFDYGPSFIVEFVTEAFVDTGFQAELTSIIMPESNTSLWNEFKNIIRKIFGRGPLGKTTLLDETVDLILSMGEVQETVIRETGDTVQNTNYLAFRKQITEFTADRAKIVEVLRNFDAKHKGKSVYTIDKLFQIARQLSIPIPKNKNSRQAYYDAFLNESTYLNRKFEDTEKGSSLIRPLMQRTDRIFQDVGKEKERSELLNKSDKDLMQIAITELNQSTSNSILQAYQDRGNYLLGFEKQFIASAIMFNRYQSNMVGLDANLAEGTDVKDQIRPGIMGRWKTEITDVFINPPKLSFKTLFPSSRLNEEIDFINQLSFKELKRYLTVKKIAGRSKLKNSKQKKLIKEMQEKLIDLAKKENQETQDQALKYETEVIDSTTAGPYEGKENIDLIQVTREDGVVNNFVAIKIEDRTYYFPTIETTLGDALSSNNQNVVLNKFLTTTNKDIKMDSMWDDTADLNKNIYNQMNKELDQSIREVERFRDVGYKPVKTEGETKPDEILLDTPIDRLSDDYQEALSKPLFGIPAENFMGGIKFALKFIFPRALTTRIKAINAKAFRALMSFHQNEKLLLISYQEKFKIFEDEVKRVRKSLKSKQKAEFTAAILNGDWEVVKKFGVNDYAIDATKEIFNDIANRLGFPPNENYYRREVLDYKGLVEFLGKNPTDVLQSRLNKAREEKGRSLTPRETKDIVRSYLTDTNKHDALLQKRTVDTVTPEMVKFYASPLSYMENYFSRAARISARSQLLGKRPKVRSLSVLDENGDTIVDKNTLQINEQDPVTDSDVIDIVVNMINDPNQFSPVTDKDGNPVLNEDGTPQMKLNENASNETKELVSLLKSAINYRPAHKWATKYRTLTSAKNILQVPTILLQLADIPVSAVYNGLTAVLKSAAPIKGLTDRAGRAVKMGLNEIGIQTYDVEFQEGMINEGARFKLTKQFETGIQKFFKTIFLPLGGADFLGKSSLVKSTTIKYLNLAEKNPQALYKILKYKWEDDVWIQRVIKDLQDNVMSGDVKLLLYMEMAEFHPITTSDHIKFYIDNAWARPFLVLQSFAFKMVDRFGRQAVSLLASGAKDYVIGSRMNDKHTKTVALDQIKQGTKGAVQFVFGTLIIEQVVRKLIKESMQALKIEPDEYTEEEVIEASVGMKWVEAIFSLNPFFRPYDMKRLGESGDFGEFVDSLVDIAPFIGLDIANSLYKDMVLDKTKDKIDDFDWLKDIPLAGDVLYGKEKREEELREL